MPPLPLLGVQPTCHCGNLFGPSDVVQMVDRGLVQVTPGEDAVEVVDVAYKCPKCGINNVCRFQKGSGNVPPNG